MHWMPLNLWLSLVALCAMGAMSPGPSLAMVLRHTLAGGRSSGVVAGVSHAFGVGIYAAATAWGLGALVAHYPGAFRAVMLLGAVYLAWLGYKALRSGHGGALEMQGASTSRSMAARDGLLVALANPKLILFFVALLSQFITPDMSEAGRWLVVLTAMVIDGVWYVLVALVLSHSRVLPWLQARSVWINRLTGVVLLALALRVVMGA